MTAPDFCGDGACALRLRVFLSDPEDPLLRDPCPACLAALAATLGVRGAPRTLREVYAEVPR